jgi:hypothetical protein
LRGGVLAVASTLLGLAAHAAAGGQSVYSSVLLPLAVLTAVAGAGLAGDNPRPTRAIGVLAASQLAMQAVFVLGHRAHPHVGPPGGPMTMIAGLTAAVVAIGLMLVHADESAAQGSLGWPEVRDQQPAAWAQHPEHLRHRA